MKIVFYFGFTISCVIVIWEIIATTIKHLL
jgi:hypothetical protein